MCRKFVLSQNNVKKKIQYAVRLHRIRDAERPTALILYPVYRVKKTAARPPRRASEPAAREEAPLVGTVAGLPVLVGTVETAGVTMVVTVVIFGGEVVAVWLVAADVVTGAAVVEDRVVLVTGVEEGETAAEVEVDSDPLEVVPEALAFPPEMTKGNEYWKVVWLESRVMLRP